MSRIEAQRALEALRNGVPNADAVRKLGCMQPEALDRFRKQLEDMSAVPCDTEPQVVPGLLISGGFGSGKSHTLSHFEIESLRRNFIVSRVVISKETPLHDPVRLFQSALRNTKLPDCRGSLMQELAGRIDYRSPNAATFAEWVKHRQPHQMLAASVCIHEQSRDPELKERMVNWWSGEKLDVRQIRDGLKELEIRSNFVVKAVTLAALAPVRFEFAARLARAAGYFGWVLLFDEVELISRYSLLQRARAYAEIARWMCAVPDQAIPGITAVAAITDDFDIEVLDNRQDREKAPARLRQKGDVRSLAQEMLARIGIELITGNAVRLHAPNDDTLKLSFERLSDVYEEAYGHRSSRPASVPDDPVHRPMRSYVRRWISEWDLDRLYGERPHDVVEEATPGTDYTEDADFEAETDAGGSVGALY